MKFNAHATFHSLRFKIAILLNIAVDASIELHHVLNMRTVKNAERFFKLSGKLSAAKAALASALDLLPSDDFGLRAKDGKALRTLTPSAKQTACWQITRFDTEGQPWGDTHFEERRLGIDEFLTEVDLNSIEVCQYAERNLTEDALLVAQIESDALELAGQLHTESHEKDFEPTEALLAVCEWARQGRYSAEALRIAVVASLDKRGRFRRKAGVLRSLGLPIVEMETKVEPAAEVHIAAAMVPPIVAGMFEATDAALAELRQRISNVVSALIIPDGDTCVESIYFKLDGLQYCGTQRVRNLDLCVGSSEEADKAIALRVYLDGDAVRSAGLLPRRSDFPFLQAATYEERLRQTYLGVDGYSVSVAISSRTNPQTAPVPPVGAWMRDSCPGVDGHAIWELVTWPVADLEISEDTGMAKAADVRRYAQWMLAGSEPPPVFAVQSEKGRLVLRDHRRVLAAKVAGKTTIRVWVSWTTNARRPDYNGPCGLTSELASAGSRPRPVIAARPDRTIFVSDQKMVDDIRQELSGAEQIAA